MEQHQKPAAVQGRWTKASQCTLNAARRGSENQENHPVQTGHTGALVGVPGSHFDETTAPSVHGMTSPPYSREEKSTRQMMSDCSCLP